VTRVTHPREDFYSSRTTTAITVVEAICGPLVGAARQRRSTCRGHDRKSLAERRDSPQAAPPRTAEKWKFDGFARINQLKYRDFFDTSGNSGQLRVFLPGAFLYIPWPHQPALYVNTVSFSSAGRKHSIGPAGEANPALSH
jgi:hypothetical protein